MKKRLFKGKCKCGQNRIQYIDKRDGIIEERCYNCDMKMRRGKINERMEKVVRYK